jgi:hypothetical protein
MSMTKLDKKDQMEFMAFSQKINTVFEELNKIRHIQNKK